jgi:hypothetical protein
MVQVHSPWEGSGPVRIPCAPCTILCLHPGPDTCSILLTLIGAVIEDIEGLLGCWPPLLVTKNEINPLMQVSRNIL